MGTAAVGIISCDYGPVDCCLEYEPEPAMRQAIQDASLYAQMCHNSMAFDDEYDLDVKCRYREVDRLIDAAAQCCEPLKPDNNTSASNTLALRVWEPRISAELLTKFLPVWLNHRMLEEVLSVRLPTNAYAWCLLNTHPRTYACDLQEAREFEQAFKDLEQSVDECCADATYIDECLDAFIENGVKCVSLNCCDGLPEQDNKTQISKSHCEEIVNTEKQCIQTPIDACCRKAPNASQTGGITKSICKSIYQDTSGKSCINDDEKYANYQKSE